MYRCVAHFSDGARVTVVLESNDPITETLFLPYLQAAIRYIHGFTLSDPGSSDVEVTECGQVERLS